MGRVTHELLQTQLRGGVSSLESSLARFGVWVGELRHKARDVPGNRGRRAIGDWRSYLRRVVAGLS